jgi:hypothetical protein
MMPVLTAPSGSMSWIQSTKGVRRRVELMTAGSRAGKEGETATITSAAGRSGEART